VDRVRSRRLSATGTYRFEETVSVTPRPGDDAASVPVEGGLVDIEFTLRVASP
jgi:hypothetical protein